MKCWPAVSIIFILFGSFIPQIAVAQSNQQDSLFYLAAKKNAVAVYHRIAAEQLGIYNGRTNAPYPNNFENDIPYFETTEFSNGSLVYEDILYENVPLLYDDLANILVIQVPSGWLQLTNEKIKNFSIRGHSFIRIIEDSANQLATGYYEVLHDGNVSVLKKLRKKSREETSTGVLLWYIDHKEWYYYKIGNTYYEIKGKTDIFQAMPAYKQQVQDYIKKTRLNFKRDRGNSILQIGRYLDLISS